LVWLGFAFLADFREARFFFQRVLMRNPFAPTFVYSLFRLKKIHPKPKLKTQHSTQIARPLSLSLSVAFAAPLNIIIIIIVIKQHLCTYMWPKQNIRKINPNVSHS